MDAIARSIWYDNELYKKVEWHYPVGDIPDEFFMATGIVEYEDWNGQWVNYYDLCVTKHDKEEEFLNAFDEFVKTL